MSTDQTEAANLTNQPVPSDALSDDEVLVLDDIPEIVEIRMQYTKDVVQLAKGSGCSWK